MGISGLLPLLKSIQRPTELKRLAGETLGVDAYGWLHRGAISCAIDLAQGRPTRKYVDYAMQRVRMAQAYGVTPYMVFDGDFLPSKAATEKSRAKRREESRKAGLELLKAGKPSQAHLELQKAIDITPEMARHLIDQLKKIGVPYVVAPYEADAQLVYLERQGAISGIISEDSDLLVFGARRLLTKLDQYGQCVEINRRDFCACREVSLTGWTDADFRHMAIFSGCDYLEGIPNMGLKTAYRVIRKHKTPERVVRMVQFEGKHKIPADYLASFRQAELTFLYQRVFCPAKQALVPLTEPDSAVDLASMPYIGVDLDAGLARGIAAGDINPITREPIVVVLDGGLAPTPLPGGRTAVSASPSVKPIDSYFDSSKRIPLAQMDPNCFSTDPSRLASITMNGQRPRVFPLPRPYLGDNQAMHVAPSPTPRLLRRRTEPVGHVLGNITGTTAQAARRRTAGPALLGLSTSPDLRPQKKARLCEDSAVLGGNDSPGKRSRFFSRDSGYQGKKAGESPQLADKAIDAALQSLPEVERWNQTYDRSKDVEVFEDQPEEGRTLKSTSNCAATPHKPTALDRPADNHSESPAVEVPASSPIQEKNTPDDKVPVSPKPSLRSPLGKFLFSAPNSRRLRQGSPLSPAVVSPNTPASQSTSRSNTVSMPRESRQPVLTPLQRIGAQAFQRSSTPRLGRLRGQGGADERLGFSGRRRPLPINPAFVPLPQADLVEVETLNQPLGSEDQLIPESDSENETASCGGPDDKNCEHLSLPPSTPLDLSRFLYV